MSEVKLPNGTVISPDTMSATDRFNAVARSVGAPEVPRPAPPIFGPQRGDSSVVVDEAAIAALNRAWVALSPEARAQTHALYREELSEMFSGRKLAETRDEFRARMGKKA